MKKRKSRNKKVLVLFTRLSGYICSCLTELNTQFDVELLIYAYPASNEAPFDYGDFVECGKIFNRFDLSDHEILERAFDYDPDLVFVSGWLDKGYMSICRMLKSRGKAPIVVAGMDTQWVGNLRQRIAIYASPYILKRSIDIMWVSGERQWQFANRLGYRGVSVWDGYYSADWPLFSRAYMEKQRDATNRKKSFLFVGRYVYSKGIDLLAKAYRKYAETVEDPWDLVTAGSGPDKQGMDQLGIRDVGFTKPQWLPLLMKESDCLILPSRYEPWGVVIHEATACGLPVIASDACGASVHLLRDGWNGYLVEQGKDEYLVNAMLKIHNKTNNQLVTMSKNSYELSKQYTPHRWASQIYDCINSNGDGLE